MVTLKEILKPLSLGVIKTRLFMKSSAKKGQTYPSSLSRIALGKPLSRPQILIPQNGIVAAELVMTKEVNLLNAEELRSLPSLAFGIMLI